MNANAIDVANIEQRAEYLRQQTGHRSWASVITGSDRYECHRCGDTFSPSEEAVAFHYSSSCLNRTGVPAYVSTGDAQPARLASTAV